MLHKCILIYKIIPLNLKIGEKMSSKFTWKEAKNILIFGYVGTKLYKLLSKGGCPKATKDVALNTRNRQLAIEHYMYGAPNPSMPSLDYYKALAKKVWGIENPTSKQIQEIQNMRCWNCSAFDISPRMKKCLPPDNDADEYDLMGMNPKSTFGYCWMHHFKCRSDRTCATWAGIKPITTNKKSLEWQEKYG